MNRQSGQDRRKTMDAGSAGPIFEGGLSPTADVIRLKERDLYFYYFICPQTRKQAERQHNCWFREEFVEGWNRYSLALRPDRLIGFNRAGYQMRPKNRAHKNGKNAATCYNFIKLADEFDINRHNNKLAGNPSWRPQPRLQTTSHLRHRHRHRKNDGT